MHRVAIAALFVAASGVSPVPAQPVAVQPDERLELFLGAGGLAHYNEGLYVPPFPAVYHLGGVLWLDERWGIAVRHSRGFGYPFDPAWYGPRYQYVAGGAGGTGTGTFQYSTVTGRFRVLLDNRIELEMGVGAQLSGAKELHLRPGGSDGAEWVERDPWGPGLALEMFVGRRLTRRFGIEGGVMLQGDWSDDVKFQPVVLASVAF